MPSRGEFFFCRFDPHQTHGILEKRVEEIDRIVPSISGRDLRLEHRSARAGLAMNLHLGEPCLSIPQSIDTNLTVATRLIASDAGREKVLFTLKE